MFQHAVDWTVDPLRAEHALLAAQREADKCAATHQSAAVIEALAPVDLPTGRQKLFTAVSDSNALPQTLMPCLGLYCSVSDFIVLSQTLLAMNINSQGKLSKALALRCGEC